MILILQVAAGVTLGVGFWLALLKYAPIPKWFQPNFSMRCQIDRIDLTAYRIKVSLERLGG